MKARLEPLDGLRGIAIALVVWFHVWQITWLPTNVALFGHALHFNAIPETGFLGVDLFFFISGFCLYYPYARATFGGRTAPTTAEFAYRRALKILPSYLLAIAVLSCLGATFTSTADAVRQIALHVFFVHVWFDDSYGSINGVLWSIAVEVQFYVFFPLIAWAARRHALATFFALVVIANVYRAIVHGAYDVVHLVNQLPGVLDLFAWGMGTAWAYCALVARFPGVAARRGAWTALSLVGFLGIVATIEAAYGAKLQPDWPSAWLFWGRPGLAAALACATLGALLAVPAWQRCLANPLLVFLSLVSYNLYLWHAAVARVLLERRIPGWHGADQHADAGWGLAFTFAAAAAALGVASLVPFAVERPLRRMRPFAREFAQVGRGRKRSPGRRCGTRPRIRGAPMWRSCLHE